MTEREPASWEHGGCQLGLYICTRDWCCISGKGGNHHSPFATLKDYRIWRRQQARAAEQSERREGK